MLTRTRSVLELHTVKNGLVRFYGRVDEDTGKYTRVACLSQSDWEDMGSPTTVTISIEPGDTLNEL